MKGLDFNARDNKEVSVWVFWVHECSDLVHIHEFFNIFLSCFLLIFLEPFSRSGEYILDSLYSKGHCSICLFLET